MPETPRGNVGYSTAISDPAFQMKTSKQGGASSLKYLLFVVPLLVLVVLWQTGALQTWLFVLLAVAMVVLILPPILKERRKMEDVTYDGVIESVDRREPVSSADISKINPAVREKMILHTIRIKEDEGKMHVYERTGGVNFDFREYYLPGDRVRHHRGFDLPEKYDKSKDDTVVCIVCGKLNSMDSRKCGQCGTVLLK